MSDTESNLTPEQGKPSPEISFLRNIVTKASRFLRDPKNKLTGSARLVAELIDRSGTLLADKSTYDQIAEWQREFDVLQKTINTHGVDEAAAAFDRYQSSLHARVTSPDHGTHEILSREEYERKFAHVRESASAAQAELYQKNISTARTLAQIAAGLLEDHAIALEAEEKARFTRYGLPYTGSPLVAATRKAREFVLARVSGDTGTSGPEIILPWLIL